MLYKTILRVGLPVYVIKTFDKYLRIHEYNARTIRDKLIYFPQIMSLRLATNVHDNRCSSSSGTRLASPDIRTDPELHGG